MLQVETATNVVGDEKSRSETYIACFQEITADGEQFQCRVYGIRRRIRRTAPIECTGSRWSSSELLEETIESPDKEEIDGTNSSEVCTIYSPICRLQICLL